MTKIYTIPLKSPTQSERTNLTDDDHTPFILDDTCPAHNSQDLNSERHTWVLAKKKSRNACYFSKEGYNFVFLSYFSFLRRFGRSIVLKSSSSSLRAWLFLTDTFAVGTNKTSQFTILIVFSDGDSIVILHAWGFFFERDYTTCPRDCIEIEKDDVC